MNAVLKYFNITFRGEATLRTRYLEVKYVVGLEHFFKFSHHLAPFSYELWHWTLFQGDDAASQHSFFFFFMGPAPLTSTSWVLITIKL